MTNCHALNAEKDQAEGVQENKETETKAANSPNKHACNLKMPLDFQKPPAGLYTEKTN